MTTVEIRDRTLARVGVLSEQDLTGVSFTLAHNAVGTFSIVLPEVIDGAAHEGVELLRAEGSGVVITLDDGSVFSGLVESRQSVHSVAKPEGEWTFTGRSDLRVLADEVAWPDPASLTAPTTANDVRTAARETLLHQYAAANGTRLGLTDGTDGARGDTITKSPRFDNLLTLLQDIASDQVCFDVVQDGEKLKFVTWVPADRTIEVQLDYATGALSSMTLKSAAPKFTRAIVLGQDEGTARQVVEVTNDQTTALEAAYGRRVTVVDQRQTDDITEQTQAGTDALTQAMASTSNEAVPSDDLVLGEARPGDWITLVDGSDTWAVQLETVPHAFTNGPIVGATVGPPIIATPDTDDPVAVAAANSAVNAVLAQRILALATRLDSLERKV